MTWNFQVPPQNFQAPNRFYWYLGYWLKADTCIYLLYANTKKLSFCIFIGSLGNISILKHIASTILIAINMQLYIPAMRTSSNGNIFHVTGHLGNSPVTSEFPAQRPVMRSFDVFFDLHLNKWLSKQSWGWWFEMPSCPLWRHCDDKIHIVKLATMHYNAKLVQHPLQNVSSFLNIWRVGAGNWNGIITDMLYNVIEK